MYYQTKGYLLPRIPYCLYFQCSVKNTVQAIKKKITIQARHK